MPAAGPSTDPIIPTVPLTTQIRDSLRAVVGEKGLIEDEHGIGIDKLDELSHYRSKTELDIMRTIKRALDPQNIMNPGKVLRV